MNGKSILLTTHLLEEADLLCKDVAFIINGHIVAYNTPENLKLSRVKRSLDVALSGLKNGSQPAHAILKMDDPSEQQRLVELLAQGNVRTVHYQ